MAGAAFTGFLGIVAGLGVFFVTSAPVRAGESVNKGWFGVAIKGYDTVAYFTEDRPVKGSSEFEVKWQGAKWRFSNRAHRDRFKEDPEAYAPRYGGYCAGGMALGRKASIDPTAWAIVDGKLYLNHSKKDRDTFVSDPKPRIAEADKHWQELGQE